MTCASADATPGRPVPPIGRVAGAGVALCLAWVAGTRPAPGGEERELFEGRIRPVLVERCYACHNAATTAEGGLAVDSREGLRTGGHSGPALVPGDPRGSLLVRVLRHEVDGLKMPKDSGRLPAEVVADFERWIAAGAPDPRDTPPTAADIAAATSWDAVRDRRMRWWSFQPLVDPPLPDGDDGPWARHPVDRFVAARLRAAGVAPADEAPPAALVRRVFYALIGLPPSPEESAEWSARIATPGGWEALVDHLLADPHFGERWARHWMDWIRYADTHGSEGDPEIVGTHLYRDTLIRALATDVPVDRLIREHLAGDLLPDPRLDPSGTLNESRILTAHWRMVFHGYSPTDALEEKVRFVDDQINAVTKAFLGLTVSCARCHDHKFDPVSQRDYYALFGVVASSRPGRMEVGPPAAAAVARRERVALEPALRAALASRWRAGLADLRDRLARRDALLEGGKAPEALLHPLYRAGAGDDAAVVSVIDQWRAAAARRVPAGDGVRWELSDAATRSAWSAVGSGLDGLAGPPRAGTPIAAADGPLALDRIMPAALMTHRVSTKHAGRLTSPVVRVEGARELWVLAAGGGGATVRYVVEDYPRAGPVYPIVSLTPEWKWHRFDLGYWDGDRIHVELATARDAVLPAPDAAERSWFAVREARLVAKGTEPPPLPDDPRNAVLERLGAGPPTAAMVGDAIVAALGDAIEAWRAGDATDRDALLLDAALAQGLLENRIEHLGDGAAVIADARRLEGLVPAQPRAPGPEETAGSDQPLLPRGDHRTPGPPVPRGVPALLAGGAAIDAGSGRRIVAEALVGEGNPLTRRVIANRVWHHLFGRGIVATPDNLGHLGQPPTHPELLDHLAVRLGREGWSLKGLVRYLLTSRTWRLDSVAPAATHDADPENRLWSRALVRRLDAEAIRDGVLAAAGTLDRTAFGPPVGGGGDRRSIYVRVARNAIDPMLRVFDFPEPFSTTGARDETNVPAQALTMLNDPDIARRAERFADRVLAESAAGSDDARLDRMVRIALGRPSDAADREALGGLVAASRAGLAARVAEAAALDERVVAHRAALDRLLEADGAGAAVAPPALYAWDFSAALDGVGRADAGADPLPSTAHGAAVVRDGGLALTAGGYVTTAPLPRSIRARTLAALVQLDGLEQRGGGVVSIQSADGVVFDAVVYGEQAAGQWLAGSDVFARTRPFVGPVETEAATRPVHVAICWDDDGTVRGYRDGVPYGESYRSAGVIEFPAERSVVSFGLRHLPAGGNRMLAGRILHATLHDRALSAAEVAALAASAGSLATEARVARLAAGPRREAEALLVDLAHLERQRQEHAVPPPDGRERAVWSEPARALFLCKEFLFLR